MQIEPLNIVETSGYSKATIVEAFNDVIHFCWFGGDFKCGSLPFSQEGASHFADCIPLFRLDLIVFIITSIILVAYLILILTKTIYVRKFNRVSPLFYGAVSALLLVIVLGILVAIDFDKAFKVFHKIFFPGKSNWLFSEKTDPVIKILPQQFFMNCAILIGADLLFLSLSAIIYSFLTRKKRA